MIDVLPTVLTVLSLVGAAWSALLIALNRPLLPLTKLSWTLVGGLAVLELGLLVQAVAGIASLLGTDRDIERWSFAGYLLGPVVILPVAVLWSAAERTRWSAGVLVVACLSVPVMIVRLGQIWAGHG
ncbi:hypothetical protein SAMN04488074_102197 [Lentzea albidocapillata subsp. violacea]|uniref:Uncharacterized protein n=1 Tax=Lentzea albidocapillata subsp. violacea TaxID=128104 RepID=A0A1G8U5V2_9PSEU|nr:hypothetical protein [Lentzea albidocapillata]SDJ49148.1 hypothetical protein SAMN04488074_102197 [Lentzea albidocapillata subsp. violacea]